MRDDLGDRMKRYEDAYRIHLPTRMPLIIRVDGRAFHTFTKGLQKPFDLKLIGVLHDVAEELLRQVQGSVLAFAQSDEISLLVNNYKTFKTEPWFQNNLQKMASVAAGIASAKTTSLTTGDLYFHQQGPAVFDARVFVLPKEDVCNYFLWRQQDAQRNAIQSFGQFYFGHKKCLGVSCKRMVEMFEEEKLPWHKVPRFVKDGAVFRNSWYRGPIRGTVFFKDSFSEIAGLIAGQE